MASIPSPGASGFHAGPLAIHFYGLMYVVAVLAAVSIVLRRWQAKGGSSEIVFDVALWAFPAGIIGGRLYFLATSWGQVPDHWWGPLAVWGGGLGIWGGIALGSLVGIWRLRKQEVQVGSFLDAAAPAILDGQAIGRIGNYFNQELFGKPTDLPWGLQISPEHRPPGYALYATFHPTFLYELSWDLGLAAFLVWLGAHKRVRPPGLFALYVSGYSAFRIFEDSLRIDPAHHVFGLRLNFYVACGLTVLGAVWFVATQRRDSSSNRRDGRASPVLFAGGGIALAICGCGQTNSGTASAKATTAPVPAHRVANRPFPHFPRRLAQTAEANGNPPSRPATVPPPVATIPSAPPKGPPNVKAGDPMSMPAASAGSNGSFKPPPSATKYATTQTSLERLNRRMTSGRAGLLGGIALTPPSAPQAIQAAIAAANSIVGQPYVWGGGHSSWISRGYDCSGAVSFALGGGGFLAAPLNSTQLQSWGLPGPGRWLTVYANSEHAYATIAGLRWDTVGDANGSGPRWHAAAGDSQGFVARHPAGY